MKKRKRTGTRSYVIFSQVLAGCLFLTVGMDAATASDFVPGGKMTAEATQLSSLGKLAVDRQGMLYVVDSYKNSVRAYDSTGKSLGQIVIGRPSAVAAASDGTVYIGSHQDYSVAIYKNGQRAGYLGDGKHERRVTACL
jgi:DNA-binding beta-propeller fold protein YncE